ncbi:MAG: TetR-like C-terminal domain-containing protein [Coriobacteriales bacterium]|nr:TetR-like C-terminal domain-containing protein [Coriobacteriales bacterium]
MNAKTNQRVVLTKRLLKESLLDILKHKHIQDVSITELCGAAGINRSTFYAHYRTPVDVLTEIKGDFAQRMAASLAQPGERHSPRDYLEHICTYIFEHRAEERIILSNSSDDEVLQAALASSFEVWGTSIPFLQLQGMDEDTATLAMAFYYHGIFRVIREWIRRDINKSPQEVAELLDTILFKH